MLDARMIGMLDALAEHRLDGDAAGQSLVSDMAKSKIPCICAARLD
jgi:hypothetical protein